MNAPPLRVPDDGKADQTAEVCGRHIPRIGSGTLGVEILRAKLQPAPAEDIADTRQ